MGDGVLLQRGHRDRAGRGLVGRHRVGHRAEPWGERAPVVAARSCLACLVCTSACTSTSGNGRRTGRWWSARSSPNCATAAVRPGRAGRAIRRCGGGRRGGPPRGRRSGWCCRRGRAVETEYDLPVEGVRGVRGRLEGRYHPRGAGGPARAGDAVRNTPPSATAVGAEDHQLGVLAEAGQYVAGGTWVRGVLDRGQSGGPVARVADAGEYGGGSSSRPGSSKPPDRAGLIAFGKGRAGTMRSGAPAARAWVTPVPCPVAVRGTVLRGDHDHGRGRWSAAGWLLRGPRCVDTALRGRLPGGSGKVPERAEPSPPPSAVPRSPSSRPVGGAPVSDGPSGVG
ncbi:hypothetical protein SAVIM338S_02434 [Streptomyces avidinii]